MVIILNGHMMIKSERWVSLKVSHEPHIIYNIKKKKNICPGLHFETNPNPIYILHIGQTIVCVCFPQTGVKSKDKPDSYIDLWIMLRQILANIC